MSYKKDDFKLDSMNIEAILDKLIPMIAEPDDHDFFRAIIGIKAEESTSAEFSMFVAKLLRAKSTCTTNP